jgi:signal transduction histidine kinase/ActR/RegA family two-component response regulator
MDSAPPTDPPSGQGDREFEQQLREMNEALLIGSVHQHELADQAQKAEGALAKALAYGNDIIATLREPFLVLDHDLRVKTANRSFYDSFHVSKEETENRLVYDLGNGQWDIPALRTLLEQVLSCNQSVHDYEVEHSFPALGRKTMLLNARPFPPESKNPELILLAVYDISAVRQRADELAAMDRRKDEFLAMLSHELRNPLAPIMNAVYLLGLQKNENQLQYQARTVIERQVAQLTRLIDDLMEVSRITSGRVQLRNDRVVVSGIVERAVETARSLIDERKHELTVSLPPQPIWLNADAARLEQVVINLLTNAAKYTDKGGHIWLTVQEEDDECVLRVRDTGVGIPPEVLPRVFELFTQAARSLDRSQGGLGIGLALVQRLVEMHQGTVSVVSVLGHGSEFVVHLPRLQTAALLPTTTITETVEPTGPTLRILVVDDNVDSAQTLAMLLEASGHDVRTAHDGPAALEAALDYRPAVALLDIGLPGLDGFEVAARIRQQIGSHNIMLVAMTGYGLEKDRQRSQEAGFDHHLVKPVQFEKLQEILASVSSKAT